jgi:hypothetical protein
MNLMVAIDAPELDEEWAQALAGGHKDL